MPRVCYSGRVPVVTHHYDAQSGPTRIGAPWHTQHVCSPAVSRPVPTDYDAHGPAIQSIDYWAGRWWAYNGEYATPIAFCPFCGSRLPIDGRERSGHLLVRAVKAVFHRQ